MDRETLRKVQLVQLEILKEIKRVCEEAKIDYFLASGTLLGAIRHKGFIPWDDDLDVGMKREDYIRFIKAANDLLDEKYELVDWNTDPDYPHAFAKVMKKGTVYIEEKRKDNGKQGIWVDVFPYDAVPNDSKECAKHNAQMTLVRGLIRAKSNYETWHHNNKFLFGKWLKNFPLKVISIFFTKQKLVGIYEKLATKYNARQFEKYYPSGTRAFGKWNIPKQCLDRLIDMNFEDDTFKVPEEYDLYLTVAYGDYMKLPPESERENRHQIVKVKF